MYKRYSDMYMVTSKVRKVTVTLTQENTEENDVCSYCSILHFDCEVELSVLSLYVDT